MSLSLRRCAIILFMAGLGVVSEVRCDTLRITTTPPGAKVELNGVRVGVTPFEKHFPGGYFRRVKTALGSRLEHPLLARLTLPGYSVRELILTEGPMEWTSLNGRKHMQYWLFKGGHFEATLSPLAASFAGAIKADFKSGALTLAPEMSLADVTAATKPAVVKLSSVRKSGSGFFIDGTGLIATNAHVARDEETMLVDLEDGQRFDGRIAYIDEDLDIALIKIQDGRYPALVLAPANTVRQGDRVFAISNPAEHVEFSMTEGVVNGVGELPSAGEGTWIQTTAGIFPGSSGGPLMNMHGEVIGLMTQKLKKVSGATFALSTDDLLEVLHGFYPTTVPRKETSGVEVTSTGKKQEFVKQSVINRDLRMGVLDLKAPIGGSIYIRNARGNSVADQLVGTIPSKLLLPAGDYVIRVTSDGSADWIRTIRILGGSKQKLDATEFPPK